MLRISAIVLVLLGIVCLALTALGPFRKSESKLMAPPNPNGLRHLPADSDFQIFSDPASPKITIRYFSPAEGYGLLYVYQADGKLIVKKPYPVIRGANTLEYNFSQSVSGIFILEWIFKDQRRGGKVVKEVPSQRTHKPPQ